MTVVDNNVLSALAKAEALGLLLATFDAVATTPGVVEELDTARIEGYRFVERIDDVRQESGWLTVLTPTDRERRHAEEVRDHTLSFVDAECISVAALRNRRLLTDDRHAGTVARQRDVDVWDLPLFCHAAIRTDALGSATELRSILDRLERRDATGFRSRTGPRCSTSSTDERRQSALSRR